MKQELPTFGFQPLIGLFGTCGPSTFRDDLFIPELRRQGIPFFNPQLPEDNWNSSFVDVEARHLEQDAVVLLPVTSQSLSSASLIEQGYAVARAVESANTALPKFVIAMVQDNFDDTVASGNELARKESLRSRALGKAHLNRFKLDQIVVVNNLPDMLKAAIEKYRLVERMFKKV